MTSIDICNMALALIGDRRISSISEAAQDIDPLSRYCAEFYPRARQEALAAHRWTFAKRLVELDGKIENKASATLGTGDAALLFTAKNSGVAGNDLTAAIAIDATTDRTQLTVTETAGDVVVTSGDKRRMIVTADFGDGITTIPLSYYPDEGLGEGWSSTGTEMPSPIGDFLPFYEVYIVGGEAYLYRQATVDGTSLDSFEIYSGVTTTFPDEVDWSTASKTGGATGTPTVTAAPATAAQAVALDQSTLSVTLANAVGSDGTGALAAVGETSLTDGEDKTFTIDGFNYVHFIPTDCLRVMELVRGAVQPDGSIAYGGKVDQFKVYGKEVRSAEAHLALRYVGDEDDPTEWTPHFRSAVARLLASYVSGPVADDPSLSRMHLETYERVALPNAQYYDAVQDKSNENSDQDIRLAGSPTLQARRNSHFTQPYDSD